MITRKEGLLLAGKPLHTSTLHLLLRRRLNCGEFDYDGVTKETWDTVQRLLDQRKNGHTKAIRRDSPFTGLVKCGHCALQLVGELKKGRYVYYHCTVHRGKHREEPYTRQETLVNEFAAVLGDLVIPKEVLDWLAQEVTASDTTEAAARQATIKRVEGDVHRIEQRLRTLYEDRLEQRITLTLYDEKREILQAQLTDRKKNSSKHATLPYRRSSPPWTSFASPATPPTPSATRPSQNSANSSRPPSRSNLETRAAHRNPARTLRTNTTATGTMG
jgi:site-specific DNA recombinase